MLECQKRANKKWRIKNREKMNEYCKIRYNNLKDANDEKYQKQLIQKREYYHRKKIEKKNKAVVESETPNEVDEQI